MSEFNKDKIPAAVVEAAANLKYENKDGHLVADKDFHKSFAPSCLSDEVYQALVNHNAMCGSVASLAAAEKAQDLMKADEQLQQVTYELPIGDNARIKGTIVRKHVFAGGDEPINSYGIVKAVRYESDSSENKGAMAQVKAYARARGASLLGS